MTIGSVFLFFKTLPSTNTRAAYLLKNQELADGTIIYTHFQSAGRGQMENRWESEDGKNLLFSTILFPVMIIPDDQFLISMTISLGICDFLQRYTGFYSIKWPNDIYVGNDKIAGILIENSIMGEQIEHSIVGIGININQKIFLSDAPNPVSLSMVTGIEFDLTDCLNQLSSDLNERYQMIIKGKYGQIKEEYISHLYLINEWHTFRDKSGAFTGRIKSVTDHGRLKIEKKSGNISLYSYKEIEFIL
jgi:BirA family transcriptional regulator, biotin operon repressor / biotin---[acetyl-CoA-carboxylase] ligase